MNMDYWSQFEWIRNGEGGGNREGYDTDLFSHFTASEKEKAKKLLLQDYKNGDVFAASGIAMLLQKRAEPFLSSELSKNDISISEKIHLSCLLSYVSNNFSHSAFVIGQLKNNNLHIKYSAIRNLDFIKKIIPKDYIPNLNEALLSENDRNQRYYIGRLVSNIINEPGYENLAIDWKFSNFYKEREDVINKYLLSKFTNKKSKSL